MAGPPGSGSGALKLAGGKLINTLLAANNPGGNGAGTLGDLGHNLSSDGTCAFINLGSLNNTDPKLSTLANNGGPTLTIALRPDSPAIDAGDNAVANAEDQRGFPRPIGAGNDIGAYEYGSPALLTLVCNGGNGVDVFIVGKRGQTCCVLVSENLRDWHSFCTTQINETGTTCFHDVSAAPRQKFYRVLIP
jgi:hypothetical protein